MHFILTGGSIYVLKYPINIKVHENHEHDVDCVCMFHAIHDDTWCWDGAIVSLAEYRIIVC